MQNSESHVARRKFLGLLGLLSIAGFAGASSKGLVKNIKPEPKKVRLLGQDGKLFEVDASVISDPNHVASRKKVSDKELQDWIKK